MVQFHNLWDCLESPLEVGNLQSHPQSATSAFGREFERGSENESNLLEVVTQFDHWGRVEHAGFIQDKLAVLERVDIALDQQQVRAALDWQESTPWNIDTVSWPTQKTGQSFSHHQSNDRENNIPPLKCLMAAPAAVSSCGCLSDGNARQYTESISPG